MEAANEAARRAVNAILSYEQSDAPRAPIWPLEEPDVFAPLREFDRARFRLGLPHINLGSRLKRAAGRIAGKLD